MAVIGTPVVTDERSFYVKCFGMDTSSNINTRYRLYVQDKTKLDSNSYIGRFNLKANEHGGTDSTFYVTLPNTYTVEDVGKLILYDSIFDSEEDVRYVTLTYVKAPSIPTNIYYPVSINSYNAVSISWSGVSGATSYVLERALHGSSSFTQVYSGSGTSYSDRIPSGATKAQYRVKAVNSGGSLLLLVSAYPLPSMEERHLQSAGERLQTSMEIYQGISWSSLTTAVLHGRKFIKAVPLQLVLPYLLERQREYCIELRLMTATEQKAAIKSVAQVR